MSKNNNLRLQCLSFAFILLLSCQCFDAKRIYSGGSNRRSSSSSSSSVRRTSGSSKPSYSSNHENTRLSYSPNYNSAPKPSYSSGSSLSSNTHTGANSPPIGWNVPKSNGPPPAYSATNPVGGAKTNIHEPAPAYKPATTYNGAPPSYSSATNTHTSHTGATGTAYRPRYNGTGGSFGSNYHTPIAATNYQGVQSNYPKQTYYSPGQALPAGATYHPSGLPAGATYHSPGALPAGATYHSPGALPAGATYYPQGGVPHGGYYPAGPAAMPPGATYYNSPSALPAGATYMSSPPQSSSGLGFLPGLLAGGLAGGVLGHVLTPSGNRVETVAAAPAAAQGQDGKIIIINNGPPGSVTTGADGTTVINAGGNSAPAAAPAAAPAPAPAAPGGETPLAPMNAPSPVEANAAPAAAAPPADSNAAAGLAAGALGAGAVAAAGAANAQPTAAPVGEQATPAPGQIVCMNVKVPEPDPADNTKTIEVDKIVCFPAPAAPVENAVPTTAPDASTLNTTAGNTTPALTTLPDGVPLAPLNEGVPAALSEQSGLKVSGAANNYNQWILMSTLFTTLVAYCLH